MAAVVKANAYGHGLLPVARAVLEAGAAALCVATVEEGVRLREAGIRAPIVLLCAAAPGEVAALAAARLTPLIGDRQAAVSLAAAASPASEPPVVHLEIDTGIGRAGCAPDSAVALWREARQLGLRVTGLCTHFACAGEDGPGAEFTAQQEELFAAVRAELERAGARFETIHRCNSAALLMGLAIAGGDTWVRPGLLLYGISPRLPPDRYGPESQALTAALRPALTLKARVGSVRTLPAGWTVSYGATYRLPGPGRVATVLIGYGDGYPAGISPGGSVLLHGRHAPVLGRVCMDQIVADVSEIPEATPGDVAVLVGVQGARQIRAEQIAALMNITGHALTTCLTDRLPRHYLNERVPESTLDDRPLRAARDAKPR